jgi:glycosyltransferase involved in cell wall biosynthesis
VRTCHEGGGDQNWYNRVIPNYFDVSEFTYVPHDQKEPWVLFLRRVCHAKGIVTCIQATGAAGVQLKIAGQGRLSDIGIDVTELPHVEELGYATVEQRRRLLSSASALIIASTYAEPFGGVQVEALLSGTPIITPFFGAFAEVNRHDVTGFYCYTLRDFRDAVVKRKSISSETCREHGLLYSLERVAPLYERYFHDVADVHNGRNGWLELDAYD